MLLDSTWRSFALTRALNNADKAMHAEHAIAVFDMEALLARAG